MFIKLNNQDTSSPHVQYLSTVAKLIALHNLKDIVAGEDEEEKTDETDHQKAQSK